MVQTQRLARLQRDASRCLAGLGLVLALFAATVDAQPAEPKCSPPPMVNLSMSLAVDVDGAGPAAVGSTGRLRFTVGNQGPLGGPRAFRISHFPDHGLATGVGQPLKLFALQGALCHLTEHVQVFDGEVQLFYSLLRLANGPDVGDQMVCEVGFEVLAPAYPPHALLFRMRPDFCAYDADLADNEVWFAYGGGGGLVPQAVPAAGGPLALVGWLLLTAAMLCLARAHSRWR